MRLVAVSIVKNEADIIEPFVRHTLDWVDHHLILDHDSTDGTREILAALKAEGLPLTLYTDDAIGNLQQQRSNHLTRLAAQTLGADWILLLDADEILAGPSRAALEKSLTALTPDRPANVPLVNYYPTSEDDPGLVNPVGRLRYCSASAARTQKILVPRALALDADVTAGKGSHALYRGADALPAQPLPGEYHLAHLALRSPQHQVLRVVLAELQKLSRGQAHAGLDEHYRLGFQLLAEDPALFFATVYKPVAELQLQPIEYRGATLRYGATAPAWNRVARALLPFLEKLAVSHGRLLDATAAGSHPETGLPNFRELPLEGNYGLKPAGGAEKFSGFKPVEGWGPQEGPVPEAFLPPFHWGYAPATRLVLPGGTAPVRLVAEALSYSPGQIVSLELNGVAVLRHAFARVNQKESLTVELALRPGDNQLVLHYGQHLQSALDPRRLAVLFLSLRVVGEISL